MAAVWAAGPEPMMMTLECWGVDDMVRAVGRPWGAERGRGRGGAAAAGVLPIRDCGWNEAAARRGRVLLERRVVRRRKVEENRMAANAGFWVSYLDLGDWMFQRGGRPKIYMCGNGVVDVGVQWLMESKNLEAIWKHQQYRVIPTTAPLDPGEKGALGYLVGLTDLLNRGMIPKRINNRI